jgi:membrane-associated progesterone receptor component
LALQSFDKEVLTQDLKGPLDNLADLNVDQLANLESWEEHFSGKYTVVGWLVAEDN